MNFTYALNTILKYGGHIRRAKYPEVEMFANNDNLYAFCYDTMSNKPTIIVAELSGEDVMANDWEVNLVGKFVVEA